MSTFQSIIYAVIHGITEFLPVSASAHNQLVSYLLDWPAPSGFLLGALSLGAFLALLIYFIHDWASMISCFLQVLIYRKKPMTPDERMPLFLAITSLPVGVAWYYFHERLAEWAPSPLILAGLLAGFAIPLWISDRWSRKTKAMFDWNWLDSLIVGVAQIAMLIPGAGRSMSSIYGALFRNYNREAAAKYSLFAAVPVTLASAITHLRGIDFGAAQPMSDLSWLSFYVTIIVTLLAGLLGIASLMRGLNRRGFGQYVGYRFFLAAVVVGVYFYRNR